MTLLDSPEALFRIANMLALVGWTVLALAPLGRGWGGAMRRFSGRALPLLFAASYIALVLGYWGPGGFGSLDQVRELFGVPQLLIAGWLHYLAFDLFVGAWISERAAQLRMPQWLLLPLLALTFLFGPAGLLAYALLRRTVLRHRHAAATAATA